MEGSAEPYQSRLPRWAWTTLGHAALGIGAVGIIVPGLPTTPLVLLAASCYAKGSERFHAWLTEHRLFGPMVRDWQEHRAISLHTKAVAILVLWVVLGATIHFFAPFLWVKVVLAAIGLGVTAFLVSVKTRPTAADPPDLPASAPPVEVKDSR